MLMLQMFKTDTICIVGPNVQIPKSFQYHFSKVESPQSCRQQSLLYGYDLESGELGTTFYVKIETNIEEGKLTPTMIPFVFGVDLYHKAYYGK